MLIVKITAFCDISSCSLVEEDGSFRDFYCLHYLPSPWRLMMAVVGTLKRWSISTRLRGAVFHHPVIFTINIYPIRMMGDDGGCKYLCKVCLLLQDCMMQYSRMLSIFLFAAVRIWFIKYFQLSIQLTKSCFRPVWNVCGIGLEITYIKQQLQWIVKTWIDWFTWCEWRADTQTGSPTTNAIVAFLQPSASWWAWLVYCKATWCISQSYRNR
jgi:hypothetical protein